MPRRKREFTIFSMSFLDVMSCGFGAVLLMLLYMQQSVTKAPKPDDARMSEVDFLDREVLAGRKDLAELKNTIAEVTDDTATAQGRARQILAEIAKLKEELADSDKDSLARVEHLNQLRADVRQMEEQNERLRAEANKNGGNDTRAFKGEGDRQYLTGLKLGGQRILILFDRSASMLDNSLVNVLRLRNMPVATQQRARKWQNAQATVDWLSSRLPAGSQYQLYAFSTRAEPVLADTAGKWLPVSDRAQLERAIESLHKLAPQGGTSLAQAFAVAAAMNPKPDNIFLITDGLPTQGADGPAGDKATGRDRQKFFRQAVDRLPTGIPVNVILEPMEGDPDAAASFWRLAQATRGSFLAPSRDWP